MDDKQHEQREQPGTEHRQLREYEYPDPEAELGPVPAHHLTAVPKQPRKGVWAAVIVLVFLAAVTASYFLYIKPQFLDDKPTTKRETSTQPKTETPATPAPAPASAGGILKSTKLNLEVTTPTGWTGSEDPASGVLTLKSPSTTYKSIDKAVTGNFVLTIRRGLDSDSIAAIHNTNAVQDSESIAYSAPTPNQYQYTHLTIGGSGDIPGYVLVTSSEKFKKGEAMARYAINGDSYIIFGSFHSADKQGLKDYDGLSGESFTARTEYKAAVEAVKSLKIN